MSGSFLDTNVLIYAASADVANAEKAEALIAAGGIISVQVLNEFVSVSQGKLKHRWAETSGYLRAIRHLLTVCPLTIEVHDAAVSLAQRYGLHIYDATIAAAALRSDCDTLYSEDMHDGLFIEGTLRVINPFSSMS